MLRLALMGLATICTSCLTAGEKYFSFALKNEKSRPAIVYVPVSKKSGTLLVVLHGGSRNAKLAMTKDSENEWNKIAEEFGWVILYPSGTTNQKDPDKLFWNDCRLAFGNVGPVSPNTNDVEYLDGLIKKIMDEEALKNVFISGHSNGGGMTFRMAMESSITLSGIAPMLMNIPRNPKRCKDLWETPLPAAFLIGTIDPMVSFAGGTKGRSGAETLNWLKTKNKVSWEASSKVYDDLVKDDGLKAKSSTVLRKDFGPAAGVVNLSYFEVQGGGHQVPGPSPVESWIVDWLGPKNRDISVRMEIAKFFQQQTERSPVPKMDK